MLIPHLYRPREYQKPLYNCLAKGYRRGVAVMHRRSGKDITAFNLCIKEAYKRPGAYYYFFPTYTQGRKILWDGFDYVGRKFFDYLPPGYKKNDQDMKITLPHCGAIIQIVGTDKFDRIVGPNPVGCIFSEYALQDPRAWDLVRPILAENRGWALFLFTPRGKNHGWEIYQVALKSDRWFCCFLTVDHTQREDGTPVISEGDIDEEREDGMSEDMVQQEFYCSFELGIEGSYYAKLLGIAEKQGRIIPNVYDPACVVNTAWDFGVDDSNAIWFFQTLRKEVWLVDYYENNGEGLRHYAQVLEDKRREMGYIYGEHYAPHDVEAREKFSGLSLKDQAKSLGINFVTMPRDLDILAGIEGARGILPRCWFDEERARHGLDTLQNYRKEYNRKLKKYSNRPLHDWASHGADAFRTLAKVIEQGRSHREGMSAEEARRLYEENAPPSAR